MSKSHWLKAGIALVVLGGIFFLIWGHGSRPLAVGEPLPRFSLQQADGGSFSLREDRQHVVLVNFWATWCPPCVEEASSLEKFARQMQPLGVLVVGVSVDQDLPALQKFIFGYHLTYPILRDPNQRLASSFGTYKFPETYIFDRYGRLTDKIIGATDWEDPRMIRFVEALAHWIPASKVKSAATSNW